MSVRQLKANKITKDRRSWVFIQYSYGLDGKRHQYQSPAFMTDKEAIKAEEEYLNKLLMSIPKCTKKGIYLCTKRGMKLYT